MTVRAFLTDFGLAKATATGSRLTRTGVALGTPAYMSPEQARGDLSSLSPATDVWALGCVLWQMLAGRPPFEGDSPAAVVGKALLTEPPALRRERPDLPGGLETLVRACLGKAAAARPRDASAVRDDLDRVLRGERPLARRRRSNAAWLAASAILAAVGVGAGVLVRARKLPPAPAPAPTSTADRAAGLAARGWATRSADPRGAAELLRQALELAPDEREWRVRRGCVLWILRDGAAARAEWDRVLAEEPGRSKARLYRALEALFRFTGPQDVEQARPDLEQLVREGGREGRIAQGALHEIGGDWAAAREALAGIEGWEAGFLRAYLAYNDQIPDPGVVIRESEGLFAEGFRHVLLHRMRAACASRIGDPALAETEYTRALELDPTDTRILADRAIARIDQQNYPAAEADIEAISALDPGSPFVLLGRSELLRREGRLSESRALLDEALRLEPGLYLALHSRGRSRSVAGDARGAIEDLTSALGTKPEPWDEADTLDERGSAWQALGDHRAAFEDHDRALKLRPGWPRALVNRSNAREALGDRAGALDDLDEAIRLDPGLPEAWTNRGLLRHGDKDFARAIEDYDAALRCRRAYPEACNARGAAREAQGDLPGGEADYAEAVRLRPGYLTALRNLGMVRRERGNWKGAAEAFQEYVRYAPPDDPELAAVHRVLSECRGMLGRDPLSGER
ncbi:MAG: tetratricopeptide repeat protein [Planctomycetales bacterium]|nr:tetratricopeptide repeat protein [Planctomycetales bacterium]